MILQIYNYNHGSIKEFEFLDVYRILWKEKKTLFILTRTESIV